MKKASVFISVISLVLSLFVLYQTLFVKKHVYVDINRLLKEYDKTESLMGKFEKRSFELQSESDSLMTDWKNSIAQFEKDRVKLSGEEIIQLRNKLKKKQDQLSGFRAAIQEKIKKEDMQMSQNLLAEINKFVEEYGEEHRYDFIFGAQGNGSIMYAGSGTDLTDDILKGLNKNYEDNM